MAGSQVLMTALGAAEAVLAVHYPAPVPSDVFTRCVSAACSYMM